MDNTNEAMVKYMETRIAALERELKESQRAAGQLKTKMQSPLEGKAANYLDEASTNQCSSLDTVESTCRCASASSGGIINGQLIRIYDVVYLTCV